MAVIETHRSTAGVFAGFAHSVSALFGAVAEWNDARITRKSLSKLSARELEDIGLSYGDIESVAQRTIR